ncbi:MAG: hypothetical protein AAF298_03185, partial [Cyanobacteria bacterium P01_A01_bin.40]
MLTASSSRQSQELSLVESKGAIMLRPSLLDLYVRLSVHTAPEYPNLCDFGSCVDIGDNFC